MAVNPEDYIDDDYRGVGENKYFTFYCPKTFGDDVNPIDRFFQFSVSENSNNDAWSLQRIEVAYEVIPDSYD